MPSRAPLIGLSCDADDERYFSRRPYADAVAAAGGIPVLLPHRPELADAFVAGCDAVVLTGGDDPDMAPWGITTHPKATPVHASRQSFELALLAALNRKPDRAVLGICLGMQYMALHAGGMIDQHLPDRMPTHADHWGKVVHDIQGDLGAGRLRGPVLSHHRQAVVDSGTLTIAAHAHDGLIEAVRDPSRLFYLGVQWHPERTDDAALGAGVIQALVEAARASTRAQGVDLK